MRLVVLMWSGDEVSLMCLLPIFVFKWHLNVYLDACKQAVCKGHRERVGFYPTEAKTLETVFAGLQGGCCVPLPGVGEEEEKKNQKRF